MKGIVSLGVSALAVCAGSWIYMSSKPDLPGREVRIKGGRTAINFLPETLKKSKLTIDFSKKTTEDCDMCTLPGFQIENSDLKFRVIDGKLAGFDGGKVSHEGQFKLTSGGKTISADKLTIEKNKEEDGLTVSVDSGKNSIVAFELKAPRNLHKGKKKELVLQDMEVVVSDELAAELGDPNLSGSSIGSVTLYAMSEPADGGGEIEVAEEAPAAGLDISLSAMSSLAVATNPTAKVGTYPGGRTGLTMSTTSCNVGTVNVPWNAPMQTTHPVIALNVYRVLNGKFEQIGWSWLKHGFLSTNSNGCGSCQHPGTGSLLGLNCSDTYGTGNNGDRTYLGPRDEVNPFTGIWTCTNSWFSNYQNDCVRRNPGQATFDAVDHRIDCLDEDLNDGPAGARYFYEAYYITPNDINTYNNLASREASFSWNGSSWSVNWNSFPAQIQGPAINRWGEMRMTATPQTEGDVIVAVQTTDLGNGRWRYDYALYNHNLDRQVREFSVPIPFGADVTNVEFRDIDRDANNGWSFTQNDHSVVWRTTAFGAGTSNPLKYSSVFNFRFETNVPPASSVGTLGQYKPGQAGPMSAGTRGPLFVVPPTSYSVFNGTQRKGDLESLRDADNDKLVLGPVNTGIRDGSGLIGSSFAPAGAITRITMGVESSNTLVTGGGATQVIQFWNWSTSQYETLDTRPATNSDSSVIVTISSNADRFVNATTREVKYRILHNTNIGDAGDRWTMSLDQVGVHFN